MSKSTSTTTTWSLCLTSKQGRTIIQLSSTASIRDLYEVATIQLNAPISALKYGFPPKLADPNNTCPIHEILQNQERIQVELEDLTVQPIASTSISTSTLTSTSSCRTSTKRAAAQRATEAMPAIIQAQEQLWKQQQQQEQQKSLKRPRATTSSQTSSKSKKPSIPSLGTGRRLVDGATIVTSNTNRKTRTSTASRKRNTILTETNKNKNNNDLSEALLGALNDSGKMGQVLRKGMRNAVQASYETTKAFSRLGAIQGQSYSMTVQESLLLVTYHGSVDKTRIIEEVDWIPRDVLEAVLQNIHSSNEEALRPENLAQLSPRVLWSLVHIFPNHSNISDMYKELLPDLNWSFLRRRAQQLSEKALENLRQQQQDDDDKDDDGEKAMQVIAAVEHAMEHLQEYTAADRQTRIAQAALQRWQTASTCKSGDTDTPVPSWTLVAPTEIDRDELRECIQVQDGTVTKGETTKLVNKLLRECQIHNWRELANVDNVEGLAEKLQYPVKQVQLWIDHAQDQSVDEIIVEICDQNTRAVELLTEKARSATPKDLAMWRAIPQLLHQRIGDVEGAPTLEQLRTWSQRAHQVLQELEWLNWYATPVE